MTIAMVRVALDLKIYDTLAASKEPVSLEKLTQITQADPILLGQLMHRLEVNHGRALDANCHVRADHEVSGLHGNGFRARQGYLRRQQSHSQSIYIGDTAWNLL